MTSNNAEFLKRLKERREGLIKSRENFEKQASNEEGELQVITYMDQIIPYDVVERYNHAVKNMGDLKIIIEFLDTLIESEEEIQSESTPVQPIKDNKAADLYNFLRAENQEYEAAMALLEKAKKALADAEAEHNWLEGNAILDQEQFARMKELEKLITIYKEFLS